MFCRMLMIFLAWHYINTVHLIDLMYSRLNTSLHALLRLMMLSEKSSSTQIDIILCVQITCSVSGLLFFKHQFLGNMDQEKYTKNWAIYTQHIKTLPSTLSIYKEKQEPNMLGLSHNVFVWYCKYEDAQDLLLSFGVTRQTF